MTDDQKTADTEAADLALPAKFANWAYVRISDVNSRIALAEKVGDHTNWHNAFAVPTADLETIATFILELLKEHRSKQRGDPGDGSQTG